MKIYSAGKVNIVRLVNVWKKIATQTMIVLKVSK